MEDKRNKMWHSLFLGLRKRCPQCGRGKLFVSYLKPIETCPACKENFSEIRADDAPPWLTILVTGHIMAPLIIYFAKYDSLSQIAEILILLMVAIGCIGLILPLAKGFFIAAIWITQKRKS